MNIVLRPVTLNDTKMLVRWRNNENVINLVYLQREGKPLLWKKVAVSNAVINGRNFVLVRSVLDGVEYNRRNNYRLPLDIKGNIASPRISSFHFSVPNTASSKVKRTDLRISAPFLGPLPLPLLRLPPPKKSPNKSPKISVKSIVE